MTAARAPRIPLPAAAVLALALAAPCLVAGGAPPAAAQQQQQQHRRGPVPLFPPTLPAPPPAPAQPAAAAPGPERDAPRPAPEPTVQVEPLAPPSVDATGLPAPEGLAGGDAVWAGSDPRPMVDLLERLPARTANPALRALTRLLLVGGGPVLPGEEGRPLAARIGRLLDMGELDAALALLRRLPAGQGGEALERLAAEALLLAGDAADACARGGGEDTGTFRAPFWTKLAALCRLRAGERAAAGLAVDLLREEADREPGGEADDPLFFALARAIDARGNDGAGGAPAADAPPLPEPAGPPSPLHLALMREAGVAVPGEPLERLAPEHLAAIARDPATRSSARRVAAAERAAALGALPPGELAAVYAAAADLAGGPPIEAAALARLAATPAGRARLYRALRGDGPPPAWAPEAVGVVWRAVDDRRLRPLLARLFAAPLADLPPTAGAGRAGAVLGLLALDRADLADAWWRPATDPAPLAALFALARGEAPDAAALAAWRRVGSPADGVGLRLLALFEGLGTPAAEPGWRALLDDGTPPPGADRTAAAPPPSPAAALPWLRLRHAAPAGRTGEAALSALLLLDARPEDAHPLALADALAGLRRVGLEREARAVALDAALTLGGRALATGAAGDG